MSTPPTPTSPAAVPPVAPPATPASAPAAPADPLDGLDLRGYSDALLRQRHAVVDFGQDIDDLPATPAEVLDRHALGLGMTPAAYRQALSDAGVAVEAWDDAVARRGLSYDAAASESRARGVRAFLPPEEREARRVADTQRQVIDDALRARGTDPAEIRGQGGLSPTATDDTRGILGSTEAQNARAVAQPGEPAFQESSAYVHRLLAPEEPEGAEIMRLVDTTQEHFNGASQYIDKITERRIGKMGLTPGTMKYQETVRRERLRALREVAMFKTIGLWTGPAMLPSSFLDDVHGDDDDGSVWDPLKPTVEIVGVSSARKGAAPHVVIRQQGATSYVFDLADMAQSAAAGALRPEEGETRAEAALRGMASRDNFLDLALESEAVETGMRAYREGDSTLERTAGGLLAGGVGLLGLSAAVATPDLLFDAATLGKLASRSQHVVRAGLYDRKTDKTLDAVIGAYQEAITANRNGDTALMLQKLDQAAEAEVALRRQGKGLVADVLDVEDADIIRQLAREFPDVPVAGDEAARLGKRLPGDAGNVLVNLSPGARKLRATRKQTPLTDYAELYDWRKHFEALDEAEAAIMRDPAAIEGTNRFRAQVQGPLATLDGAMKGLASSGEVTAADAGSFLQGVDRSLPALLVNPKKWFDARKSEVNTLLGTDKARAPLRKALYRELGGMVSAAKSFSVDDARKVEAMGAIAQAREALHLNLESRFLSAVMTRQAHRRAARITDFDDISDIARRQALSEQQERVLQSSRLSPEAQKFSDALIEEAGLNQESAFQGAMMAELMAKSYEARTGRGASEWWRTRAPEIKRFEPPVRKAPDADAPPDGPPLKPDADDAAGAPPSAGPPLSDEARKLEEEVRERLSEDYPGYRLTFMDTPEGRIYAIKRDETGEFYRSEGARARDPAHTLMDFEDALHTTAPDDAVPVETPLPLEAPAYEPYALRPGARERVARVHEAPETSAWRLNFTADSEDTGPPTAGAAHTLSPDRLFTMIVDGASPLTGGGWSLRDTVGLLRRHGSADSTRVLADRIYPLIDPETPIFFAPGGSDRASRRARKLRGEQRLGARVSGHYDPSNNEVVLTEIGVNERTLTHESLHAATTPVIFAAVKKLTGIPYKNVPDISEDLATTVWDIHDLGDRIRKEIQRRRRRLPPVSRRTHEQNIQAQRYNQYVERAQTKPASRTEGYEHDIHEIIAYGLTEPWFQDILRQVKVPAEEADTTLWSRFTALLSRLFNGGKDLPPAEVTALERLIHLTDTLLDAQVAKGGRTRDIVPSQGPERVVADMQAAGVQDLTPDEFDAAKALDSERPDDPLEGPEPLFSKDTITEYAERLEELLLSDDPDQFAQGVELGRMIPEALERLSKANGEFRDRFSRLAEYVPKMVAAKAERNAGELARLADEAGELLGIPPTVKISEDWEDVTLQRIKADIMVSALRGSDEAARVAAVYRPVLDALDDLERQSRAASDLLPRSVARSRLVSMELLGMQGWLSIPDAGELARMAGVVGDEPLYQIKNGIELARTEFMQDGRAVIRVLGQPDLSTIIHELAHIARRDLTDADMGALSDWVRRSGIPVTGTEAGRFTGDADDVRRAEELFASGFERYMREGQAPSTGLQGIFQRVGRAMSRIYTTVLGSPLDVDIPDTVRRIFDDLVEAHPQSSQPLLRRVSELVRRLRRPRRPPEDAVDTLLREANRAGARLVAGNASGLRHLQTKEQVVAALAEGLQIRANKAVRFDESINPGTTHRFSVGDIAELQAKIDAQTSRTAHASAVRPASASKIHQTASETSPVEMLRQRMAGDSAWKRAGRMALSMYFGGDPMLDGGLRLLPQDARRAVLAGTRYVEQSFGEAIRLIADGDADRLIRYLSGETVDFVGGREVLSSGYPMFGAVMDGTDAFLSGLPSNARVDLAYLAEQIESFRGQPGRGLALLADDPQGRGQSAARLIQQIVNGADQTHRPEFMQHFFRALDVDAGQVPDPRAIQAVEILSYYGGVTPRGGKLVDRTRPVGEIVRDFLDDIEAAYSSDKAARVAVVVAGHGQARRAVSTWTGLGITVDGPTRDAFVAWTNGMPVPDGMLPAVRDVAERMGMNPRLVNEAGLFDIGTTPGGLYVPKAARERLSQALTRGQLVDQSHILWGSDADLGGPMGVMVRHMKRRMTRGEFIIRQRYFAMNTLDHASQLAMTPGAGFRVAGASVARLLLQDVMVLPGVAKAVGLYQGATGKKAAKALRRALSRHGDKIAQAISASKYRVDTNRVLEGSDGVVMLGGRAYRYADIREIAISEGIFASFDTSQLKAAIDKEYAAWQRSVAGRDESRLAAALGAPVRAAEDIRKNVADTAEAWGERERLGAMLTLIEMGHDPRTAARITIDALYDYAGSMSLADRHWLVNLMLPFWAFQKNANRAIFDLMFSPEGAYRMGVIRRAQEFGTDLMSDILYQGVYDPYGIDTRSMPDDTRQKYYGFRHAIENGYGEIERLPPDMRAVLEAQYGSTLEALDAETLDFIENGYGGAAYVPDEARLALRALFGGHHRLLDDGRLYEMSDSLIARMGPALSALGSDTEAISDFYHPGPQPAGRASFRRDRAAVAVTPRMNAAAQIYYGTTGALEGGHSYMELFIPESTITAGFDWMANVTAFLVLNVMAEGDRATGQFENLDLDYIDRTNALDEVLDVTRAPLPSTLMGSLGIAEDELIPTRVHPWLGRGIEQHYGIGLFRVTASMEDPFVAENFRRSEELEADAREALGGVRPERYYLPPGIWSFAFNNSPLGELNQVLLRGDKTALESTLGTRGDVLRWARVILGAETAQTSGPRQASIEEPRDSRQTLIPPDTQ